MDKLNSDDFLKTRRMTVRITKIDGVPVDYLIPHEDIVNMKLPLEQITRVINPSLLTKPPKTDKALADAMRHGETTQANYNQEWKLIDNQTHLSTAEKNLIRTALVLQVTLEMLRAVKPEACKDYLYKHLEKIGAATHADHLWGWCLEYPDIQGQAVYLRIGDRIRCDLPDYID